jgi:hypothetical protein
MENLVMADYPFETSVSDKNWMQVSGSIYDDIQFGRKTGRAKEFIWRRDERVEIRCLPLRHMARVICGPGKLGDGRLSFRDVCL